MSAIVTTAELDDDGTWLITLRGDHDLATRAELARETGPVWALCRIAIIDLRDVGFIDSGVIRWLLDVEEQLESAGTFTFSIVEGRPGSPAARLFEVLRMRHVLACYPTLEEAMAQSAAGCGQLAWLPPQRQSSRTRQVA
jgi:anti-anti-sigma regulatory factor